MDTGADVTAINSETQEAEAESAIKGRANHTLNVLGQTTVSLWHGRRSTRQKVYVVKGVKKNLLL